MQRSLFKKKDNPNREQEYNPNRERERDNFTKYAKTTTDQD